MNDINQINWLVEKSKDNNDILKINGKLIHSKFFPQKEALDFLYEGKNLILIFGMGLAYHVNNIIKNNPDSIFIIYEPFNEIFELSKKYLDSRLINNKKICLLKSLDNAVIHDFLNEESFVTENRLRTYSNLGYKSLFPELEKSFLNIVKRNIEILVQNTFTESNFIPLWTKNFLYNMENIDTLSLMNPSKIICRNNLAVIVCAGPTLLNDLEALKKGREKITIFCVDTALMTLIKYGINPDFIVTLDGQHYTMYDYVKTLSDDTAVIMDAISSPEIARNYKNIFFMITGNIFSDSIIDYFFKYFYIDEFGVSTGGTVSDYAAALVLSFGFNKIYFAGLDLGYPFFQSHCKGTPFYNRVINSCNYYDTPQTNFLRSIMHKGLEKVGSRVNGMHVYTDFILKNYASYFSQLAAAFNEIDFFYSNYDGIKLSGFKNADLGELISKADTKRIHWKELIQNSEKINIENERLMEFYNKLINDIHGKAVSIDLLFKKSDFESENANLLNEWQDFFKKLFYDLPFLRKFIIMTEIILQKKEISQESLLWYKHVGHKTLQSIYYIIRIIQKILKRK